MPNTRPTLRWGDDRGSTMGALMFAVVIAIVIASAALASMQLSRSRSAVEYSGIALLHVGDRVQLALDEVNTSRTGSPLSRIDTTKQCDADNVCTTLTAAAAPGGQIALLVNATTSDGAKATRQALLQQLPTSGIVTGVDPQGRLQFVQDGGTGTDLWQVVPDGGN